MVHGNSKYSLELKLSVCLGQEKKYYPREYINKVPRSTLSSWRSKSPDFFISQFNNEDQERIIQKYLTKKSNEEAKYKSAVESYISFIQFVKKAFTRKAFISFLKDHKSDLIKMVDSLEGVMSKGLFLEAIGVSLSRYSGWVIEEQLKCTSSPDLVCVRNRPRKITKNEVDKIRGLVISGGPNKHAIWANALKAGEIAVGKQTFYNWTKDLKTEHQIKKKPRKRNLIRASAIHEIWHADISVIKTLDNQKHFLYCIIDNYSRAILSWRLETIISKKLSAEVLRKAYVNSFPGSLKYMTDGGSENKKILETHFNDGRFRITHWVAGKNINSSNSMIERVFHTLKNEYKSVLQARDKDHLQSILKRSIESYMDRPHSAHGIYSPREVIAHRAGWFNQKKVLELAATARLEVNRNTFCKNCTCEQIKSNCRRAFLLN